MFNPLHPFEQQFIEKFRVKGVKAFVKQTYNRGKAAFEDKPAFILVHFENPLAAQQYFDVLKNDANRELFKTDNPADAIKIKNLITAYRVFTMLKVKDAEMKARKILDQRIRFFIEHKLNWKPAGYGEVLFTLDVQFGEVYAKLKLHSKEAKVKLEDIENMNHVL